MLRELVRKLSDSGVRIWVAGDQLGVSAPRDVLTAELRDELRRCKSELLAMLEAHEAAIQEHALPPITQAPGRRHEPFPLSDVQQAYLLGRGDALELGGVTTHYYSEREATGLEIGGLNAALNRVIARHDMLRAVFQADGTQHVLQEVPPYEITVHDMRGRDVAAVDREIAAVRERLSHQVLPADRWPLFEIHAVLSAPDRMRLYLSFDALIIDTWSLYILFSEWGRFYLAPQLSLPPLDLSFRDYILAERSLESSPSFQRSRDYWLARVDTLPPGPDLPVVRDSSVLARPRFGRRRAQIDRQTWEVLKAEARTRGMTPAGILIAAYAETLARWSKSPRFTINLTLFNRMSLHPQVGRLIGDFTSLTLLEVDCSADAPFAQRAAQVQQQLWRDLDHRYFSGVRVVREQARRRGGTPFATMPVVFTSALGLEGGAGDAAEAANVFGPEVYGVSQTPQVWLDLQVVEDRGDLILNWDAVEELFPAGMLDGMFEAYRDLLERLAAERAWNERAPVAAPAGQRALVQEANATEAPLPELLLHGALARRAAQNGDDIAVISSGRCLTYRELHACANRLGRQLRALGVEPDSLVAIVLPKGWEQVVAAYGILVAGGAYVPLDPELPRERRDRLLAESGARCALTSSILDAELEWPAGLERLAVDRLTDTDGDYAALEPKQDFDSLAYVIYTSGSTGRPKGVLIDHRGANNTVVDVNRRFGIGPADRVLALSSLSFDLSVYDIFGMAEAGGALVMPDTSLAKEPSHWVELLAEHRVTVWNSVPQLFQLLVDSLELRPELRPPALRLVMLSGDWIPVGLPDRAKRLWPDLEVISMGGATEASIWSIFYRVGEVDSKWNSIPYGKPLANQRFHVLDGHLRPRPVWVPGKLFIGGVGLAKGYWRRPEETAARFIVHPESGERLYDTGDLGRYLPDGNIEFLGREDFQVKINGFRVELGEIAAVIEQHSGIEAAVVDTVGEDRSNRQLAAWIVPVANPKGPGHGFETERASPAARQAWDAALSWGREQPPPSDAELRQFEALWRRVEQLSTEAMCCTLRGLGVFGAAGEVRTVKDLAAELRIKPHYAKLLAQWLQTLSEDGALERVDAWTFRSPRPLRSPPLEEIRAGLRDNAWTRKVPELIAYFERSISNLAALFRGEVDALELLFPGGSWRTAESIYQSNPIATYVNHTARRVLGGVVAALPADAKLRILEVGAGTGGTTVSLLPVLPPERTVYTYTDISTFFTDSAREKFHEYPFLEFKLFDLNVDPLRQGYTRHRFDVIVAANVLHDAHHVSRALDNLRTLLAPNGLLLAVETTRNTRLHLISVGFIEGLGDYQDERLESNRPLLDTAQWEEALASRGFERSTCFPERGAAAEVLGQHVLVAQGPAEVSRFDNDALIAHLAAHLPEYMLPKHVFQLGHLPLSANGKVDRHALPTLRPSAAPGPANLAPSTPLERALVEFWRESLKVDLVGVDDNFFALGGDSLIAMQLAARINARFRVEVPLRRVFENPTVAGLAALLREAGVDASTGLAPEMLAAEQAGSAAPQVGGE